MSSQKIPASRKTPITTNEYRDGGDSAIAQTASPIARTTTTINAHDNSVSPHIASLSLRRADGDNRRPLRGFFTEAIIVGSPPASIADTIARKGPKR